MLRLVLPPVLLVLLLPANPGRGQSLEEVLPPALKPRSELKLDVRYHGGPQRGTFVFSPDSRLLAGSDSGSSQLQIWHVTSGKTLGRIPGGRWYNGVGLAVAPDGKRLLTADTDMHGGCQVELWDISTAKRLKQLDEGVNSTPFTAAAFAPDGKVVALGGGFDRNQRVPKIHLWNVQTGDEVRLLETEVTPPDPNGRFVNPFPFEALAFSLDGRSLAVVVEGKIRILEMATGKARLVLGQLPNREKQQQPHVYGRRNASVAFSPDGRYLAVGGDTGTFLWDTITGRQLPTLGGHSGGVLAVGFTTDGESLLTFGMGQYDPKRGMGTGSELLVWSRAEVLKGWEPRTVQLNESQLQLLWQDLEGADARRQFGAVQLLAAAPEQTLPFLLQKIKPVPSVSAEKIIALINTLENGSFNERKVVVRELRQIGELAIPHLRMAEQQRYNEVVRRLHVELQQSHPSQEQLRAARALDILARIDRPEARKLLTEVSKGAAEALVTQRAVTALERKPIRQGASDQKLEDLWPQLADGDPEKGWSAIGGFVLRGESGVLVLKKQLLHLAKTAIADDNPERIVKLIADLDDRQFAVRERATRELGLLGKSAEPALQAALPEADLELKQRIDSLLRNLKQDLMPTTRLHLERALEALELIGSPAARTALTEVVAQVRNRLLRDRVQESLQRLTRRIGEKTE